MAETKKNIKLTDLLGACLDFKKDPSEANEGRIKILINDLIITEYLPMTKKQVSIALILGLLTEEDRHDAIGAMLKISVGKIVLGILSYVINLDNDLDRASFTPAVADLLYECGVVDAILVHIEKDYRRLETMLQEALNFSNLFALAETASLMNTDSIQQFIDAVSELKDLDPEMLSDLKSLAVAGAPEFQALKETLMDEALGTVIESDLESLQKKKDKNVEKDEKSEQSETEDGKAVA